MGSQLGKHHLKPDRKSKSMRMRLQKLRRNRTAPLFTTTSTVNLDKCDSLNDIHVYQLQSPSYLDIYQAANLEIDASPEDWIRCYKDIKNKVQICTGNQLEWRAVKQELEVFIRGLDMCNVLELRCSLLEKTHRLSALLDDKMPSSIDREQPEKQRLDTREKQNNIVDENCIPTANIRQVRVFDTFLQVSARLDAVRYRMIEYYGDSKHPEYHEILDELQVILLEVKAIKDGGVLHVIVTREEYEDYIESLQKRFVKLVENNMRQTKSSMLGAGMTRSARAPRSIVNVSAND